MIYAEEIVLLGLRAEEGALAVAVGLGVLLRPLRLQDEG